MKVNVSLESCKRLSKVGNEYSVGLVTIEKEGLRIVIEDFKVKFPYDTENLELNLIKKDGRYMIEELGYSIPWQYSISVGLLFLKFGDK